MQPGLELFYWQRPENGYEWVNGSPLGPQRTTELDHHETRYLAVKESETQRYFRYNPLVSEPLLFRQFAHTEPTEAGFLAFANRFGELGVGIMIIRDDAITVDQSGKQVSRGGLVRHDPLYQWRAARNKMREIVDVLDAIQARDAGTLRQWFTIRQNGILYERRDASVEHFAWVAIAAEVREYLWKWATAAKSEDEALLRAAQGWAQHEINEAVSGGRAQTPSTVRILFDADAEKMVLRVCPSNLLAAMWLQCARVLTLNPTFKACEHCGKWFELSAEQRRRRSKYCSGRCKVAHYRAKTPR